jgi:hypothetical protein
MSFVSKHGKAILILGLGLGLAYWFLSRLEWRSVSAYLQNAAIRPLVLAAILINLSLADSAGADRPGWTAEPVRRNRHWFWGHFPDRTHGRDCATSRPEYARTAAAERDAGDHPD